MSTNPKLIIIIAILVLIAVIFLLLPESAADKNHSVTPHKTTITSKAME
ncbi:hypothetical protein [Legionella fallonii]|uniref:Uncharacterized protein n=1 Tax=Legionella fallonii LLAP-10 TaxID=1212491 RepID=A0A098G7V9_9GAMM|nr:hypothetical protein [Legionella fallonii]CEG58538.1 exported protein of unknown function [Legionella fallonii LLAP-10]